MSTLNNHRPLMGSVCKASLSIGLMTGFSPAADNVPMVSRVIRSAFLQGRGPQTLVWGPLRVSDCLRWVQVHRLHKHTLVRL